MNIDIEPIIENLNGNNESKEEHPADALETLAESVAHPASVPETPEAVAEAQHISEEKKAEADTGSPIISLKNVDICQKGILILSDVNLTVKKGELVYIVGKTGSGKSNLLKLLYGEVPPAKGEATVAGFDMVGINTKKIQSLRRKLGIVFQDFQLLHDRSVYENLKFITKVTGWKDKDKRDDRIMEVLDRVGLKTKGHKMPHQLSGGEQQRVCIARALVNYPELILADEPTGNLDPETSYDIFQLFKEISEQGTPVLIATHDYLIVDKIPARVLFIEKGKVI